jgi:hypothetical protein
MDPEPDRRGLLGRAETTHGNTTVLRVLEAFEVLGLGLQRLRQVRSSEERPLAASAESGRARGALSRRRTTSYPAGEVQLTDARHRREVPTRGLGSAVAVG